MKNFKIGDIVYRFKFGKVKKEVVTNITDTNIFISEIEYSYSFVENLYFNSIEDCVYFEFKNAKTIQYKLEIYSNFNHIIKKYPELFII